MSKCYALKIRDNYYSDCRQYATFTKKDGLKVYKPYCFKHANYFEKTSWIQKCLLESDIHRNSHLRLKRHIATVIKYNLVTLTKDDFINLNVHDTNLSLKHYIDMCKYVQGFSPEWNMDWTINTMESLIENYKYKIRINPIDLCDYMISLTSNINSIIQTNPKLYLKIFIYNWHRIYKIDSRFELYEYEWIEFWFRLLKSSNWISAFAVEDFANYYEVLEPKLTPVCKKMKPGILALFNEIIDEQKQKVSNRAAVIRDELFAVSMHPNRLEFII